MARADEFQVITSRVAFWQVYEPSVKCDLSCCAVRTEAGLVFVDPVSLAPEAMEELVAVAQPHLIVLTNGNHARAAEQYRKRFSIPIAAHPQAIPELGLKVDIELCTDAEAIPGLMVLELPGAGLGEVALHFGEGLWSVGDALINLAPQGFGLLPPKYCLDAAQMRGALRNLLRFEIELLTFAHGLPLVAGAREKLESLLQ